LLELEHLAHHDILTGLFNRHSFEQRLSAALGEAGSSQIAVLFLDLDRFKEVNDTEGHAAGDRLLVQIARRLEQCTREGDTLARTAGDEFALLRRRGASEPEIIELAKYLIEHVSGSFDLGGKLVRVGMSVGIAFSTPQQSSGDILKSADIALFAAKKAGRATYRVFHSSMEEQLRSRQHLKRSLASALDRGEFEVFYQPTIELETNRVAGFEALLRWNHPSRGLVSPAEFIPIAEETGIIGPLGRWTLGQACQEAARWPNSIRVAVNLSSCEFRDSLLLENVADALAASRLAPERLELEITESVLLHESQENLRTLAGLRDLGVSIALDDFGTGYSSLNYLTMFPFTKIKIDRSFVMRLEQNASKAIVRSVVDLGQALNMTITAEGVETRQQLDLIQVIGCDQAQGYFISRPMPAQQIPEFLEQRECHPSR
jgi:diguanylate cyclase (GGDEF)-like protein